MQEDFQPKLDKMGAISLMKSSKSEQEWNANLDKVKKAFDGYPDWWYPEIVLSKIATETAKGWGGDADIHIKKL